MVAETDYAFSVFPEDGKWAWSLKKKDEVLCSWGGFENEGEARKHAKHVRDALHLVLYTEPAG